MTIETGIVQRLEAARRSLDRACAMSLEIANPGCPLRPVWDRAAEAYRYLQEVDKLFHALECTQLAKATATDGGKSATG